MSLCGIVTNGIVKLVTIILFMLSTIGGVLLLFMGYIFWNDDTEVDRFFTPYLWVLGTLMVIFAIYGFSAVTYNDDFMLNAYAVASLTLAIVQVGIGALFLVKIHNSDEFTNKIKKQLLELYDNKLHVTASETLISIHTSYKCCGVNGPHGPEVTLNPNMVMGSCCGGWYEYMCDIHNAFEKGCLSHVTKKSEDRVRLNGVANIVSGIIQLVAAALAASVANLKTVPGSTEGPTS